MSEHPLFSVLIANYNNGKYLQEAIDSVLAQTYTHWEIIIVDDKSTDNSYDIYHKYENNPKFHIYYNENNMGCGYTKRRCAELANGELCGFLDADDVLMSQTLCLMVKVHILHPKISCVFSRYYICDNTLVKVKGMSRLLTINDGKNYLTNNDYLPEHFVSFKKMMYDNTIGIDSYLLKGIDQDLYFKMEEIAPIYVLNEFTYKVRERNDSISRYDGGDSAFLANIIVRYEACKRRNIPYEEICQDWLRRRLKSQDYYRTKYYSVLNSHAFKIGKFILLPIYMFKKILNDLKN